MRWFVYFMAVILFSVCQPAAAQDRAAVAGSQRACDVEAGRLLDELQTKLMLLETERQNLSCDAGAQMGAALGTAVPYEQGRRLRFLEDKVQKLEADKAALAEKLAALENEEPSVVVAEENVERGQDVDQFSALDMAREDLERQRAALEVERAALEIEKAALIREQKAQAAARVLSRQVAPEREERAMSAIQPVPDVTIPVVAEASPPSPPVQSAPVSAPQSELVSKPAPVSDEPEIDIEAMLVSLKETISAPIPSFAPEDLPREQGPVLGERSRLYAPDEEDAALLTGQGAGRDVWGNPVAVALHAFMREQQGQPWEGGVSDLLGMLSYHAGSSMQSPAWPKTPRNLLSALERVAPALAQMGLSVTFFEEAAPYGTVRVEALPDFFADEAPQGGDDQPEDSGFSSTVPVEVIPQAPIAFVPPESGRSSLLTRD